MKIACINLKSGFLISDKVFPPLGILYLASALRNKGHGIKFYDFAGDVEYESVDEDIVFITITSPQINIAIDYVKKFCENKKIVIGGCGVESLTQDDYSLFNVIVRGEGDNCVNEILKNCNGKTNIIVGENADVETVSFPARDLLEGYSYKIDRRDTTSIITSRGCPFSCLFCRSGKFKNLRVTSARRVCEEIDEIRKLGYKAIMFFDDIFTLNKDRLSHIANHLLNNDIIYRCLTHINYVNKELCNILVKTGCKEVGIGIESLDNDILKIIKKGFTREKASKSVKMLLDSGIRVKTFLMIGLPGENHQSIETMRRWLDEIRPSDIDISIYTPFPGTELWDNMYKYDIHFNGDNVPTSYKGIPGEYKSVVSTSCLSQKEIVKERNKLEKEFKKWQ